LRVLKGKEGKGRGMERERRAGMWKFETALRNPAFYTAS